MLGLGAYASSDEDEVDTPDLKSTKKTATQDDVSDAKRDAPSQDNLESPAQAVSDIPAGPVTGPMLGPNQPQETFESTDGQTRMNDSSSFATPEALIQDLTLPPVPNLEIPPSPPGSPGPATASKVSHFLSLKKQGVHFNEKLAASSSLKNPTLFTKLRDHNEINDRRQYATVLPHDIWDPEALPDWAYKEELLKRQQAVRQKIEQGKQSNKNGRSIDFVSSGGRNG